VLQWRGVAIYELNSLYGVCVFMKHVLEMMLFIFQSGFLSYVSHLYLCHYALADCFCLESHGIVPVLLSAVLIHHDKLWLEIKFVIAINCITLAILSFHCTFCLTKNQALKIFYVQNQKWWVSVQVASVIPVLCYCLRICMRMRLFTTFH
jgi:hypothetical protein